MTFLLILSALLSTSEDSIRGYWEGKLKRGKREFRLVIRFTPLENKSVRGTMDIPSTGGVGIRLANVRTQGRTIRFGITAFGATFEGILKEDGSEIVGSWNSKKNATPVILVRQKHKPHYGKPQEPKRPLPYREQAVSYPNTKAGISISGILTLPPGKNRVPAVLLISGSGPHDRDATAAGHQPFLILSDYLTRRGYGVLRVDDRGVGATGGNIDASTTQDLADDVLAGVAFLKSHARIDPTRVGLIGHSEGGIIAPMAAAASSDVRFIILLGGPAVTGEEILYEQTTLIARAKGANEFAIALQLKLMKKRYRVVKKFADHKKRVAELEKGFRVLAAGLPKDKREEFARTSAKKLGTPWFRFFIMYDPKTALKKVRCPVLALFGDKDIQVPAYQSTGPMVKALVEGKNTDYTVVNFPETNHLFQKCKTGTMLEYYSIQETIQPRVLDTIRAWMDRIVKPS